MGKFDKVIEATKPIAKGTAKKAAPLVVDAAQKTAPMIANVAKKSAPVIVGAAILAAFPFAVIGFLKYNCMTAEKFLLAWFRSTFLIPRALTFGNTNVYYRLLQEPKQKQKTPFHRRGSRKKGVKKKHDQNVK